MSNAVLGVIKVDFATRDCFAFITTYIDEDGRNIQDRCASNMDWLRLHPIALLLIVLEHRFTRWTHWYGSLWRDVVEIETTNNMTHPNWRANELSAERQRYLSDADNMLQHLHATNLELCHSHTVNTFALRFGDYCLGVLEAVEKGRENMRLPMLTQRERATLEEEMTATVERFRSMGNRLDELSERLRGQINVVSSTYLQYFRTAVDPLTLTIVGCSRTI